MPHVALVCENCGTEYWTMRASDGCKTHVRSLCKQDAWCYACSYRRSMELTNDFVRLVARLSEQARQKVRFWRWELTVPHKDIQKRMTLDDGYEFAKDAQRYVEFYLRDRFGIPLGVQMASAVVFQFVHTHDPYGTRCEDDRRHLHYHGLTLGWGVRREDWSPVRLAESMFVANDPGFTLFRAGWRSVMEARWGPTAAKDVDGKIRYESGVDQLFHRVRYMLRGAVEDFIKCAWQLRGGYSKEFVRQALLWKNGRPRVRYYGFLSPRNLSQQNPFMQKLNLVIPRKVVRLKESRRFYCNHGCEYKIQFHEPMKTLAEVDAEGGSVLVTRRFVVLRENG